MLEHLKFNKEPILYIAGLVLAIIVTARGLDGEHIVAQFTEHYTELAAYVLAALAARQSVVAPATLEGADAHDVEEFDDPADEEDTEDLPDDPQDD